VQLVEKNLEVNIHIGFALEDLYIEELELMQEEELLQNVLLKKRFFKIKKKI